mmetsp:Transcript_23067/g.47009  ORF Transcript_23067/g.47009 Transcript_23067/m.47009 type:complete len:383 (-) Transcript_23067:70-1218(-)
MEQRQLCQPGGRTLVVVVVLRRQGIVLRRRRSPAKGIRGGLAARLRLRPHPARIQGHEPISGRCRPAGTVLRRRDRWHRRAPRHGSEPAAGAAAAHPAGTILPDRAPPPADRDQGVHEFLRGVRGRPRAGRLSGDRLPPRAPRRALAGGMEGIVAAPAHRGGGSRAAPPPRHGIAHRRPGDDDDDAIGIGIAVANHRPRETNRRRRVLVRRRLVHRGISSVVAARCLSVPWPPRNVFYYYCYRRRRWKERPCLVGNGDVFGTHPSFGGFHNGTATRRRQRQQRHRCCCCCYYAGVVVAIVVVSKCNTPPDQILSNSERSVRAPNVWRNETRRNESSSRGIESKRIESIVHHCSAFTNQQERKANDIEDNRSRQKAAQRFGTR